MKTIAWSEGTWTREPVSVNEQWCNTGWWKQQPKVIGGAQLPMDLSMMMAMRSIKDFPNESAVEVSFHSELHPAI